MKLNKNWNRIFAGIMAAIMVFLSGGMHVVPVAAAETAEDIDNAVIQQSEENEVTHPATGYYDIGHVAARLEDETAFSGLVYDQATVIPVSYSSVEKGYVTSVKNQNPWGTCWAFAACAAMESYALSHGLVESAEQVDFSEYALAYMTFKDDLYVDETGDYTVTTDLLDVGFNAGGNDEIAFKTLSKWVGIYNEGADTYYADSEEYATNGSKDSQELPAYITENADCDFVLTGQYYINIQDTEQIKAAIMENGAVTASYYADAAYAADTKHTYNYNYEKASTNHAIVIVGWDDDKNKDLFTITDAKGVTHTPEQNGAWLVKNSWGTYFGETGYVWISYEDMGLLTSDVVIYEIAPKEMYDNIYQHDGATVYYAGLPSTKFASIYTVRGEVAQKIQAVSFAVLGVTNRSYQIDVYKNDNGAILESGSLVATTTGKTSYEGYYTALFDDPVTINPNESYSVVITFNESAYMLMGYDGFPLGAGGVSTTKATSKEGECYAYYDNAFTSLYDESSLYNNLCIKMYTTDVTDNETPQITDVALNTEDKATISWQTVEDAVGYELWIGETSNDEDANIIELINDETNEYDSYAVDVALGTNYYYKVRAIYGEEGNYTYSQYSTVYFYEAEIPAVILEMETVDNSITLSWSEISYADGYQLYRSKDNGEFQLITEVFADEDKTFTDENLDYGSTYQYYVVSYIISQEATEGVEEVRIVSHISNTPSSFIAVPVVSNFKVNDYFYNRMIFTWTSMQEIVNGYELSIYATDANGYVISNVPIQTIDLAGGAVNKYVYDTSNYEPGTFLYVGIRSYVNMEDGTKVKSNEIYTEYLCTVMDEPIDVGVKWYVKEENGVDYIAFLLNEPTLDSIYLCYYSDLSTISPESAYLITLENGKAEVLFEAQDIPFDQKGYLYFSDEYVTTAFQDTPFEVGGEYLKPELEVIDDVVFTASGQNAELKAVVTNPMANFDYRYQWYVADNSIEEGTAIQGATSDTYKVSLGSFERKYYYCVVTTEYGDTTTVNTVNASGEHTCIVGELFGSNVSVDKIENQVYTGQKIIPTLVVKDGDTVLVEGVDYIVEYSNNVNAGEALGAITFIGDYVNRGTAIVTFNILPKNKSELTFPDIEDVVYTGSEIKPEIVIKDGETVLEENKDYTITYNNNTNAGAAVIAINFIGNYTGDEHYINFTILQKACDSVEILNNVNQTYTGQPIIPELLLQDGNLVLEINTDYILTCSNNTNAGTAKVKIDFVGNYKGTKEVNFTIVPKQAQYLTVEPIENREYVGVGIIPEIIVKDGEIVLQKGDYTVSCSNNIERGTANVIITLKGNYAGTITTTFEIVEKSAENLTYEPIKEQIYSGELLKPDVTVKNGDILLNKGTDYDVVYTNNMNVGTANAILTFKGNYTGTETLQFDIVAKSGATCTIEPIQDYTYTGQEITPDVLVKDGTIILKKDVDYSVEYQDNINAGIGTIVVSFMNNYSGSISTTFTIKPIEVTDAVFSTIADQIYAGKEITPDFTVTSEELGYTFVKDADYTVTVENAVYVGEANIVVTFTGNYSGTVETKFNIVPRTTENVVISDIPEQRYTGSEVEPELEIKDGDILLVAGQDYELTYTDNVDAGTATVTVHFINNFVGEDISTTFTIIDPIPESITSSIFNINQTNGYISKVTVGTTVQKLWSNLNEKDYVAISDKAGNVVTGETVVATGMTASIMDEGTVVKKYTVIVTGDTNGDGKINITDMIAVKACTLKKSGLSGAYEKAGDVNGDGKINITDFIKVKATTLRKDTITGVAVN